MGNIMDESRVTETRKVVTCESSRWGKGKKQEFQWVMKANLRANDIFNLILVMDSHMHNLPKLTESYNLNMDSMSITHYKSVNLKKIKIFQNILCYTLT